MRILVVEDEPRLGRYLTRGLREETYAVDLAATLAEASELAAASTYDLAVLDLGLPDGSGLDLLREWRARGLGLPVLVLTARGSVEDKVRGLDLGADDYLAKPFELEELLARVRSLLRRRLAPPVEEVRFGSLCLDRQARKAVVGDQALELTARELALLELLLLHQGRVLSRPAIAEQAWDESYEGASNVIDVLVARLRKKIREAGGEPVIQTVKNLGYSLRAPGGEEP